MEGLNAGEPGDFCPGSNFGGINLKDRSAGGWRSGSAGAQRSDGGGVTLHFVLAVHVFSTSRATTFRVRPWLLVFSEQSLPDCWGLYSLRWSHTFWLLRDRRARGKYAPAEYETRSAGDYIPKKSRSSKPRWRPLDHHDADLFFRSGETPWRWSARLSRAFESLPLPRHLAPGHIDR